jgi:hypothetical protein
MAHMLLPRSAKVLRHLRCSPLIMLLLWLCICKVLVQSVTRTCAAKRALKDALSTVYVHAVAPLLLLSYALHEHARDLPACALTAANSVQPLGKHLLHSQELTHSPARLLHLEHVQLRRPHYHADTVRPLTRPSQTSKGFLLNLMPMGPLLRSSTAPCRS